MNTQVLDELLNRLDFIAKDTPPGVGIAMGHDLYMECARRDLLEMKEFSVLGTGLLADMLPAYRGQHFAYLHPDLADWDFRVGTPKP